MITRKNIQNLGLDTTEALVYLALIELGPSSVTEITRKAGITRTLGYHVLEKLGWYGLVNIVSGAKSKMLYSANHPRSLVQHLKNKRNKWGRCVKEVEKDLPELVGLYKMAGKPEIKYQYGIEGLKNIYLETLKSKEEILSILDIEGWDTDDLRQFGKWYNRERTKNKIHERILMLDTRPARDWMKHYAGSHKYADCRWIKPEDLPNVPVLGGELNVYEDKVVMALHKPSIIGITIENTALSNILKAMFELAWKTGGSAVQKAS